MTSNHPLTDTATVKGKRGLDLSTNDWDSAIEAWIKTASQLITKGIGRPLHRVDGHTESLGSRGSHTLYLRERLPVHEVTAISYDGDAVDAADYHLEDGDEGKLVHDGGGWRDTSYCSGAFGTRQSPKPPEELYEVTYNGGFITPEQGPFGPDDESRDLPFDIEEAVIDYCVMKYSQQGRDPTVTSESVLGASKTWGEVAGRRVPPSLEAVVDEYHKPGVS